jgi:hypothetical protein
LLAELCLIFELVSEALRTKLISKFIFVSTGGHISAASTRRPFTQSHSRQHTDRSLIVLHWGAKSVWNQLSNVEIAQKEFKCHNMRPKQVAACTLLLTCQHSSPSHQFINDELFVFSFVCVCLLFCLSVFAVCVCVCVCVCWRCFSLTSQTTDERRVRGQPVTHASTWLKVPSRRDYPAHRSESFTDSESNLTH